MPDIPFFIIPLITLLAFFIKSATGFGTALILVPLGTVFVGAHHAIVFSAILDVVGGIILFLNNPMPESRRFWIPMSAAIVTGSIIGGIILKFFPLYGFELFMGAFIIILGLWFLFGRGGNNDSSLSPTPPQKASSGDMAVSTFSGLCGGLFGISGPPIVFYLGTRLAKTAFRSILIAIFLFGSSARVMTYLVMGLMNLRAITLTIVSIPALLLGLYLGNHLFIRIREIWFSRLIGAVLILSALRLIL